MNPEQQFLPAVLEIQETPPSPIGRGIAWVIIGLLLSALAWALLGHTDIVVVAPGRIVPSGHVKLIQPLEIGRVRAIHVGEGEAVEAGTLLIELDPEAAVADRTRIAGELSATESEMARLSLLCDWLENGAPATLVNDRPTTPQLRLLRAQWREYRSRQLTLEQEAAAYRAEDDSLRQQIGKLNAVLPLLSRRARRLQTLADQKYLADEQYLEMEQRRLETVHDLAVLDSRRQQVRARIDEVDSRRDRLRQETLSRSLLQLEQAGNRAARLRQELQKADARARAQRLYAPVAGVVQQLAVHTVGGVVTPAQRLMVIVPTDGRLEVEALVANRDIGFLREGQRAEVKVDAFPFTRYGLIPAELTDIASDAVTDQARGLVYKARARMARDRIDIDGRQLRLSPGMSVALEIKTGQRRLIDYFLAPLLQYRHDSIRER